MNNLDQLNKLIKMANQIGTFFESFPDREEALDGIANHLKKFWTPRMCDTLITAIDRHAANELSQIVTDTMIKHRANFLTSTATDH